MNRIFKAEARERRLNPGHGCMDWVQPIKLHPKALGDSRLLDDFDTAGGTQDKLDDGLQSEPSCISHPNETVNDVFWEEMDNIWRALKFVLHSWSEIPGKISNLVASESSRVFAYWIGKPVPQRAWEVRWASKEDL